MRFRASSEKTLHQAESPRTAYSNLQASYNVLTAAANTATQSKCSLTNSTGALSWFSLVLPPVSTNCMHTGLSMDLQKVKLSFGIPVFSETSCTMRPMAGLESNFDSSCLAVSSCELIHRLREFCFAQKRKKDQGFQKLKRKYQEIQASDSKNTKPDAAKQLQEICTYHIQPGPDIFLTEIREKQQPVLSLRHWLNVWVKRPIRRICRMVKQTEFVFIQFGITFIKLRRGWKRKKSGDDYLHGWTILAENSLHWVSISPCQYTWAQYPSSLDRNTGILGLSSWVCVRCWTAQLCPPVQYWDLWPPSSSATSLWHPLQEGSMFLFTKVFAHE